MNNPSKTLIGEWLRYNRLANELAISTVARPFGVTYEHIEAIEQGDAVPCLSLLEQYSKLLDMDLKLLLDMVDLEKDQSKGLHWRLLKRFMIYKVRKDYE